MANEDAVQSDARAKMRKVLQKQQCLSQSLSLPLPLLNWMWVCRLSWLPTSRLDTMIRDKMRPAHQNISGFLTLWLSLSLSHAVTNMDRANSCHVVPNARACRTANMDLSYSYKNECDSVQQTSLLLSEVLLKTTLWLVYHQPTSVKGSMPSREPCPHPSHCCHLLFHAHLAFHMKSFEPV